MNEILAIVVFAFFAERVHVDFTKVAQFHNYDGGVDIDILTNEEVGADVESTVNFLFDARHTFADIYSVYARILAFGIRNLYQETKDISELRKELVSNLF